MAETLERDWYILRDAKGAIREQVYDFADPTAPGRGYAGTGLTAKKVSRQGDLLTERYVDGQGWLPDVEGVRAQALAAIDRARLAFEGRMLSNRLAHQRKRTELATFDLLVAGGATAGEAAAGLVWLPAEAEATGDEIEDVAARVRAAVNAEDKAAAAFEAEAIAAKRKIGEATSAAAIRAVAIPDEGAAG